MQKEEMELSFSSETLPAVGHLSKMKNQSMSRRVKKKKNAKSEGSVRKTKAKKDKEKDTNEKSQKSFRKKKSKRKRDKDENDDEDETTADSRPNQAHMKNPTPEQKAAYEAFVKQTLAVGVDKLVKEYADNLKPYIGPTVKREIFDQNVSKNRYRDVVCNDNTRVVLDDGKKGDYIHANHIRGEPLTNEFICTQGPTADTVTDFWRMIVHCRVQHIIMLCEVMEGGKVKCSRYWPTAVGDKMTHGDINVKTSVVTEKDTHVTVTKMDVECGQYKAVVRHHHWKTWPDKSVPKSSLCTLRVLQQVRRSTHPVVVHCSAGIGRTGTLVAVEMCLQRLLTTNSLSLLEVCKKLRDQRPSAVQVDVQYVYLAQVVIEYGKAMGFWDSQELQEEYKVYKASLDAFVNKAAAAGNKQATVMKEVTQSREPTADAGGGGGTTGGGGGTCDT